MMIKQGLKTFKKPALLLSASLGLWLGVSCQDDITTGQSLPLGDEIQFSIASDSIGENQSVGTVSRSASRVSTHFLTVIGEDSLYLEVKEEENNRPFYTATEDTVESRGASYDTEKQPFKSFFLTAFLEDGAQFMKDEEVKKNGNDWEYSPIKYWPQNQAVHFFGYARSKKNGTLGNHDYTRDEEKGLYTHTFDYTIPSCSAKEQPDLIVAITPNQTKQSINGKVMMSFKHALSAIVFKVGEVPNETKLKSITFSGLYASGTGKIDQTNAITWSNTGDADAVYAQTFDMDVTDKDAAGKKTETVVSTKDQETCFMMIPQEFKTDDAKITFSFAIGPNEKDYTTVPMNLNKILDDWQASKLYTFTIKLPDHVDVEVKEDFTEGSNVKENVYISNPSVSKIYVRATVVGCWINASGDALASWIAPDNISATYSTGDDGIFSFDKSYTNMGLKWGDYWLVGKDGYYYYKEPISYREATRPLFDSYTLTAAPPVAGTTLELSVIAQSVYAEDITLTGWPVTVSTNNVLISKE